MNETTTQELPPEPPQPRRLYRARSGRVIGGVCAGLGRYFNVDPIIFRIGAVVLAFVGGAGLLAYLAALLLVPAEDSPAAESGAPAGRNRWLVIGGVIVLLCVTWPFLLGGGLLLAGLVVPVAKRAALGIGVLLVCGLISIGGAWAAAAGGETVVAIVVIGAALAILAGAFVRPVRWLVLPALALALSAGTVSAAGIDLDGGVGERDYRPASVLDLRDKYQLGMGQLVIDLRRTDLPPGDVPLEVDVGIGDARVVVPRDVCVATDAHVRVGEIRTFQRKNDGIDVDVQDRPDAAPHVTRLLVKAELGVGSLRVGHAFTNVDLDRGHIDFGPPDIDELGRNIACAA